MAESFKAFPIWVFVSENFWEFVIKLLEISLLWKTFSVVSGTMVFLFVVWMGVLFKINSVFVKIQGLQINWFTGTKIMMPEGKYDTNCYVLFLIRFIRNKNLVFYIFFCSYWKIWLAVLYFHLLLEVNENEYHWIPFMKSMKNDFIEL